MSGEGNRHSWLCRFSLSQRPYQPLPSQRPPSTGYFLMAKTRCHRIEWQSHKPLILLTLFYNSSGTPSASTGHVATGNEGECCSHHLKSRGLPLKVMACGIYILYCSLFTMFDCRHPDKRIKTPLSRIVLETRKFL